MGDTGSMLIGLMLAYAPISSLALLDPASLTDPAAYQAGTVNRYGAFIPLLVPAAILLIPYADLLMAVVRRTRAGKSVFAPDKKHLQHRLLAIGHSHRTSVLIMYLWAALFSGTVILLSIVRTPLFVLAIVTVVAVLVLVLVTMPRLRPWSRATAAATVKDGMAGARDPRPARAAPVGAAAAGAAAVSAAAASVAPAEISPAGAAPAEVAPASARPGAAGAGTALAGPAVAGRDTAATERFHPAEPVRQAGAGMAQVPETARGNAARAAIRARLAESAKANGAMGNGGGPRELPAEAQSAVPPWADDGPPPSAAGRSVPPWELPGPDATGPVPVLPRPGQAGTPPEASDGPGNRRPAPPWPSAVPPQRPAAPPWPPTSPP
jgi:hypothetical protein